MGVGVCGAGSEEGAVAGVRWIDRDFGGEVLV